VLRACIGVIDAIVDAGIAHAATLRPEHRRETRVLRRAGIVAINLS